MATGVALQGDGKIVVVGTVGNVSTFTGDFFVARLNADGTLDTSFNSSGYRTIDFGGLDSAAGVVVDPTSGQIVIAGASVSITTGSGGIALAFVNPDGSMNTNIGDETGMVVTNPGTGTIEAATSLQQIGSDYLVSGFSLNATTQNSQMMLAEFSSTGRLNYAFGTKGRAFASFGNTVELGVSAAYDPTSGLIYEAGATANGAIDLPPGLPSGTATATPTQSDFAIASFNADGTLNTNFNGTGEKTLDFNGNLDAATSVNVEGDGKIIVAGGSELSTGRSVTAIARLNPDGSLDTTFAPALPAVFPPTPPSHLLTSCSTPQPMIWTAKNLSMLATATAIRARYGLTMMEPPSSISSAITKIPPPSAIITSWISTPGSTITPPFTRSSKSMIATKNASGLRQDCSILIYCCHSHRPARSRCSWTAMPAIPHPHSISGRCSRRSRLLLA